MSANNNIKYPAASGLLTNIFSYRLLWILSFSLLTAVSAQIAIPVKPVPFSLQTMMVLLSGAFLGARNGAYSQIIYVFLGSIGLPVFANGSMGFAVLFGPTGGYLLAFPVAAFLVGYLVESNNKYFNVVISMFFGSLTILAIGILFLNLFYLHNLLEAVKAGGVIFFVWMIIKIFAAASIYFGVSKKYSKLPNNN
ncbi:MAG: biotin transporter BioY [Ignavibacteriaceae bacterium]